MIVTKHFTDIIWTLDIFFLGLQENHGRSFENSEAMLSYKIAFFTSKGIGSSNIQSHHKSIPIPTPSIPLNNTKQLPAPNSMHSEFWWVKICFPSLNIGW
jgi:hypothetical protein